MRLRVVVLDNAWENWHVPGVAEMFRKVMTLKHRGYGKEYPSNVIPMDQTDYFAIHHLVCEESTWGDLTPLMGYKIAPLSRATAFNSNFGALTLTKLVNAEQHERAIMGILERCERERRDISYDSSWTIDPIVRQDRELTNRLRKIMQAIHVIYHTGEGAPEVLAAGAIKFKMERLYQYWGYKEIGLQGRTLSPLVIPTYDNMGIYLWHLAEFSTEARRDAEIYRKLWDDRIEFAGRNKASFPAAA